MNRLSWQQRVAYYNLLDYHPVSKTALAAHQSTAHRVLVAGGEDGGKSFWTAYELGPNVLVPPPKRPDGATERLRLFTIAGPTYSEPRKEFDYLAEQLVELGALSAKDISNPREGAWMMKLDNGNTVETRSLEDPGRVRAFKPDGMAVVEAGKCQKEAIHRLIGRGSAFDSFMVLSGTFEMSEQWYHDWFRLGQVRNNETRLESYSLPTWENVANYPGGRLDPKITEMERIYPPDYFLERCAAVPVPPSGLVLKNLDPDRHIDPNLKFESDRGPVHLWADPGYGGAYAIEAFQIVGRQAFGVDEIYEAGRTTDEMAKIVKARPWYKHLARIHTIDFAGRQHQASESVIEQWRAHGIRFQPAVERPVKVWEAIERIDTSLHQGQLIVSSRMRGLLKEANIGEGPVPGMRPWRFKTTNDGTVIDRNSTDGFNHAWMAVAYGLIDHFGFAPRLRGSGAIRYLEFEPEKINQPYVRWGAEKVEVA